jgi:hypothetical protein
MNYDKACEILEIEEKDITIEKIKKQYRIKALMFHPDKNKTEDASAKFIEVHTAYEFLIKMNDFEYDSDEDETEINEADIDKSSYRWKLFSFIKSILKKESKETMFYGILQTISSICEEKAITLLESLDKVILLKVFEILKTYKDAFHFNNEFIEKIEEMVKRRRENDECIVLNPSLDDLFENNLYKLSIRDQTYIVPLWHHELVYDNSGNDIYVKCLPILQEYIEIDNKNNLHVHKEYNVLDLWDKSLIKIEITNKKAIEFKPYDLKLSRLQTLVFTDGLSKINTQNVYDVSNRALIYLHIKLEI